MGEPKVETVVVLRPKTLRSEARAVHAPNGAAASDLRQSLIPVPERRETKSLRRDRMQSTLKSLLREALALDGIPYSDAAAACDRGKPHVIDMCAPRGRGATGADLVFLARRSPTFRKAVIGLLLEEENK